VKEVLITGASSYVGARLYHDLREKFDTVGTYHNRQLSRDFRRLDTTKQADIQRLVEEIGPTTIVHAAANASAKWCEEHPEEARDLNERATKSIVDAANLVGAGVIFISSFAALDTSNVYGRTKAASEDTLRQKANRYVILRPSLVIGFSPNTTNDRPFNRILKNLDEGTPAVYDTSWQFQPTYLGHLSEVITLVIGRGMNAVTVPVAVAALKSRFDIAQDILSEFGIPVTPENKQDRTPVLKDDLSKLGELGLPIHEYDQVIKKIIEEIRLRDTFKLR